MITKRQSHSLGRAIRMLPGDILKVTVSDRESHEEISFVENIGREMVADTIVTFDIKGELGLTDGVGAIIGRSEAPNAQAD